KVRFDRSGKDAVWEGAQHSLLDFLEAQGVKIDSGCRAGSCNTCITAIKSGEVTYTTRPSTPPAAGSCLVCISVPKTNLVLDV
ncbi:MAG: 2Fe-2S iron-sulfur cluster binding domain-containing protein, partial [Armatimonadetes bacterium]|nr:2Fe-2S iron-sulfur cluster binding domain-containing protein [Armatimonadota bacterium]